MIGKCQAEDCLKTEQENEQFVNHGPVVIVEGVAHCIHCLNNLAYKRKGLMLQAADHIEKQQAIISHQDNAIALLKIRLEKVEKERNYFCDMYNKQKEQNNELTEYNIRLEREIELIRG